jgi:hypothetical protein
MKRLHARPHDHEHFKSYEPHEPLDLDRMTTSHRKATYSAASQEALSVTTAIIHLFCKLINEISGRRYQCRCQCIPTVRAVTLVASSSTLRRTYPETDRHTDRRTGSQTDGQTDIHTDGHDSTLIAIRAFCLVIHTDRRTLFYSFFMILVFLLYSSSF